MSPSHNAFDHHSLGWHDSKVRKNVRFAIRRISLLQRIELAKKVREISVRNEFLKAGGATDQMDATLNDLIAQRAIIEWGLAEITGLKIDGETATVDLLIERGPEELSDEIASAIQSEAGLSGAEIKNS